MQDLTDEQRAIIKAYGRSRVASKPFYTFPSDELTQERLKSVLEYDPDTGLFTWRVDVGRAKAGDVSACPNDLGYVYVRVNGRSYKAHRLAWLYMYGKWPVNQIDHINRVRDDNRIANLRDVTHAENMRNLAPALPLVAKKCNVVGVSWRKEERKWRAQIWVNGANIHLGCFTDIEDATKAREEAEVCYRGIPA